MKPIWFALILIPAALALGACEEEYDFTKECGRVGNCCWFDNTCNPGTGLVCNTATKKCEKAKDGGTTPVDAKTQDAKTSDAKTSDAKTSDAKTTDAKTTDAKTTDAKTTDAKTIDAKPAPDTKPTPDTAPAAG